MDRHYMSAPVLGIVTDNADPDGLGRVRVGLFYLGKDIVTGWIPMLTPSLGIFFLPEVGDQVVVAFLGDNPDLPIMLGGFWSNVQMPPVTGENAESERNKNGKNNLRFIRSRSGHRVVFDDTKGDEKMQLISSSGAMKFEFLVKDSLIRMVSKGMDMQALKRILFSGEECVVKAKKGFVSKSENIKVEGKNVNVKAGNAITVKGNGINLN